MNAAGERLSERILEDVRERHAVVRQRIAAAAARAGRRTEEIRLIGVAKRQPRERLLAAIEVGVHTLGQSYIQEMREVRPAIESLLAAAASSTASQIDATTSAPVPQLEWRLVGRLQRNKAGLAARLFDAIESVDRIELASTLSRHAAEVGGELEVLIQVGLCDEPQKGGCSPESLPALAEAVLELPHLKLRGLMTVPAADPDPERSRPVFARLRELLAELGRLEPKLADGELSMGMSGDLEVAVEEGATLVRVGTALFGDRDTA